MENYLPHVLDEKLRAHPHLMLAAIIVLAVAACVVLLYQATSTIVLYEGF
jgi:hypothetical protein